MYGLVDICRTSEAPLKLSHAGILQKTVINSLNKAILKIIHVSLSGNRRNKTTCPEMGSLRTADVFPVVASLPETRLLFAG